MASLGPTGVGKRVLTATAVAGQLDISAASLLALYRGSTPDRMLHAVASGPVPAAREWGAGGALLGLATHFTIMAVMAAVFVLAADRLPQLKRRPWLFGIAYGLATWAVMNLVVLPLRWPGVYPMTDVFGIVSQLFCHIVLVGIPIALIARR